MLELPETITVSNQLNDTAKGKRIKEVVAAYTPHKFAWYHGDPQNYHAILAGTTIESASGIGSMVEIKAGSSNILFGEGVMVRYHGTNDTRPKKHQLLIIFDDDSAISASIQMYGGLWCFNEGEFDNPYYKAAKEKPSPLSDKFSKDYFQMLLSEKEVPKLSAKAFLATEQRIPGLGNGVLQDILYNAKIHPKKKISTFSDSQKESLFNSVKSTIAEITFNGGRDTERDIFGCLGGYKTKASKNTAGTPCSICGSLIKKENYMGGSIYYCEGCQEI